MKTEISGNLFWEAVNNFCVLTTVDWKKYFAPPSVFEYIIHAIVGVLIVIQGAPLGSHDETRGCCLDYTCKKEENRVGIALGYICDDCKKDILSSLGKEYLQCFENILSMECWLGDPRDKGTVADEMKRYFKIDLHKDTGYFKSRKERVVEYIVGLSKEITSLTITTIIAFIIGFILGQA